MIGYVTLGTNDFAAAVGFYDALLAELGAGRIMENDSFVAWAVNPYDGNPATVGNGIMVALAVDSPEKVAAVHAKALELGGTDEGAPGARGGGFYAGYFRDLDGNKLNAFCMVQE